jgi:hypothetical protein
MGGAIDERHLTVAQRFARDNPLLSGAQQFIDNQRTESPGRRAVGRVPSHGVAIAQTWRFTGIISTPGVLERGPS